MKKILPLKKFYLASRIISRRIILLLIIASTGFLFSCSSSKDVITWNVELKDSEMPITDRCDPNKKLQSVKSAEKPLLIPQSEEREARVRVFGLPCEKDEDPPKYEIPVSRVKRVTYVSDPLMPPSQFNVIDLDIIEGCCRIRDGLLFFDKFELRGFVGYRGKQELYRLPGETTAHESSFFSFDEYGSSIIIGLDIAGLWNVHFIDKNGNFQLGFITGLWPMDGSLFVPLGLHGRYTFNQKPTRFSNYCNSWYLYGNFGIPFDFETEAPIFGKNMDFQRHFYGIGIGHDWAVSCSMDFSIDLGIRGMNLPLPPPEFVCPDCPDEDKYPFRNSTALLLRFGLTF